jgi:hypothetical protein
VLLFWAVVLIALVLNIFGVRAQLLEPINTTSIYWTSATVVIVCITLLTMAKDRRTGA